MVMVAALAALATDSTVRRDRYVLPTVATAVRTDATTRQFFLRLNYDAYTLAEKQASRGWSRGWSRCWSAMATMPPPIRTPRATGATAPRRAALGAAARCSVAGATLAMS